MILLKFLLPYLFPCSTVHISQHHNSKKMDGEYGEDGLGLSPVENSIWFSSIGYYLTLPNVFGTPQRIWIW